MNSQTVPQQITLKNENEMIASFELNGKDGTYFKRNFILKIVREYFAINKIIIEVVNDVYLKINDEIKKKRKTKYK